MDAATTSTPSRHHNEPPLANRLTIEHEALAAHVADLAARANGARPGAIKDKDGLEAASAFVLEARKLWKTVDETRTKIKAPYLEAGRTIDSHFGMHLDRIKKIGEFFQASADAYVRALEAEERRQREAAAKAAREEADRQAELARKAEEAQRPKQADRHEAKADQAEDRAAEATAAARAPANELVRERLDTGTVVGAASSYDFEITELANIPLSKLRPHFKVDHIEAAIRAFVKANKDRVPLDGVRIFPSTKARIR